MSLSHPRKNFFLQIILIKPEGSKVTRIIIIIIVIIVIVIIITTITIIVD